MDLDYKYEHQFDPDSDEAAERQKPLPGAAVTGDRRDGRGYVYTRDIILAVNVALAAGRPLLVRGPSGSGKSSLAPSVARALNWSYYQETITSRTHANDLLWRFNALQRLSDAQGGKAKPNPAYYVSPGVLWWALSPQSAQFRGETSKTQGVPIARDTGRDLYSSDMAQGQHANASDPNAGSDGTSTAGAAGATFSDEGAVVLLDEIDKADPDVPNNLLVPLGSRQFMIEETLQPIKIDKARKQLLIITTNEERELPNAFLRRCVVLALPLPGKTRMLQVAHSRFDPVYGTGHDDLYIQVYDLGMAASKVRMPGRFEAPSTAEYLDAVNTCLELKIRPVEDDPLWEGIKRAILWKPRDTVAVAAVSAAAETRSASATESEVSQATQKAGGEPPPTPAAAGAR